ncbi:MAG: polyprenyl synthetase family protein [Chloroflexi bacterium]|nr:polyprenyl synthetase family protein [Chloroflexota bacterium]
MVTDETTQKMFEAIELELHHWIDSSYQPHSAELHRMLEYALGWAGEGAGARARGKRIRPLLVLLSAQAAGGNWRAALPAAAAVELLHNFTLIHDDIQDASLERRGRPSLWKLWGTPQAINAGDLMFTLANQAMLGLRVSVNAQAVLDAIELFQETCVELTQGQYLDLAYEDHHELSLDDYWLMVGGKTASLLGAATQLGALITGADTETHMAYREFGRKIGLAYQAQDDLLGIWGTAEQIGKSTESDLISGKKSLPVVYSLSTQPNLSKRLNNGGIAVQEVAAVTVQMEAAGAREYTSSAAESLLKQAMTALEMAQPEGEASFILRTLTMKILGREY